MKKLTRRDFLGLSAMTAAGVAVAAACAPATPQIVEVEKEVPVEKVVKETVIVEKEVVKEVPAEKAVTIMTWEGATVDTPRTRVWSRLYEEFEEGHPYIKLDIKAAPHGTEVRRAFATANAAGTAPDTFSQTYGPSVIPYWEQGFLYPLAEYIDDWELRDRVVEEAWAPAWIEGKCYGIPTFIESMALFWRRDLFEEAGLDPDRPPENWDELAQFAVKLTIPEKNQYGYGLLGMAWASWYWENFVWQAGGEMTTRLPDGKVRLDFTDPPGVEALQFYQDLKFKHNCVQTDVLRDYDDLAEDFIAGRSAMWFSGIEWYVMQCLEGGLAEEQFGLTTLPAGPRGDRAAVIGFTYRTLNPSSTVERRDAAWEYASWMVHPDQIVRKWELMEKLGAPVGPETMWYKDFAQSDYVVDIPAHWAKATADTLAIGIPEYVLKDKIEPYVAVPVQAVLTDPNADAYEELVKCAKKIASELPETVLADSAK